MPRKTFGQIIGKRLEQHAAQLEYEAKIVITDSCYSLRQPQIEYFGPPHLGPLFRFAYGSDTVEAPATKTSSDLATWQKVDDTTTWQGDGPPKRVITYRKDKE